MFCLTARIHTPQQSQRRCKPKHHGTRRVHTKKVRETNIGNLSQSARAFGLPPDLKMLVRGDAGFKLLQLFCQSSLIRYCWYEMPGAATLCLDPVVSVGFVGPWRRAQIQHTQTASNKLLAKRTKRTVANTPQKYVQMHQTHTEPNAPNTPNTPNTLDQI